ncbi:hypothetical protein [Phocoenobacter skyensis]|uniref:Permuted papain-like amidase enzyme, YaeF/YiiX, C92 family n=1 Tax=Phocoenobacter skyensis TaxID=97481 RepID=A0A1H8A0Z8_9PAST|nr:hypothetical protein [Pasteurella skyensis]MDP8184428.1 hypothetical protein [Pasteurella skyensis]QLB22571.1 hypothetical protein A6B44_04875 [Pasteurella skyensis]SEM64203.1 hypothetical protein SAMN05444853_1347 [Pasteurella skyensis]
MNSVCIAFYKHKVKVKNLKTLKMRITDEVIRLFTRSKYSHCELVIPSDSRTFQCYSSSPRDGGVRTKKMELPTHKWDLVAVDVDVATVDNFFRKTRGLKYDLCGALGQIFRLGDAKDRYFCSEWCAEVLGFKNPACYNPQDLFIEVCQGK